MASKLSGKTKADLIAIARISGLLKTTQSQKMTKTELVEFLEKAEAGHLPPVPDEAPGKAKEEAPVAELSKAEAAEAADEKPVKTKAAAPAKKTAAKKTASAKKAASGQETAPGDEKAAPAKRAATAKKAPAKTEVKTESAAPEAETAKAETAKEEAKTAGARPEEAKRQKPEPKSERADKTADEDKKTAEKSEPEEKKTHAKDQKSGRKNKEIRGKDGKSKFNKSKQGGKAEDKHGRHNHASEEELKLEDGAVEQESTEEAKDKPEPKLVGGVLEIMPDGYGFLRIENYIQSPNDLYLPTQYIRRFNLRNGDYVVGPCRQQRESDRYQALYYIKEVNGQSPDKMIRRPHFDRLTPIYPNERFVLETTRTELSTRIIDLVAPIGKGQRGMIVSPPKAGKTILLQKIANAISANNPEAKLIVLLIDERPEEVTDMQRSIQGEVVYSTFDKTPENHVKITELVLERAERMVEHGEDVVILLDSITRMGRAYNLTINPTGRTLSGGLDPGALYGPKRFFGAARNIEGGGSLTIIATALIETGSRMDEVIFEEFKGTGNMEVYLDRKLSEKRIFPAIDINRSGTRREELLLSKEELDAVWGIRKAFSQLDTSAVTETIISLLLKTKSNSQFISSINVSFNDKSLFEAMRGSLPAQQRQNGSGSAAGSSRDDD